jgi:hypothetical protein
MREAARPNRLRHVSGVTDRAHSKDGRGRLVDVGPHVLRVYASVQQGRV